MSIYMARHVNKKSNTRDIKLCTKNCTKFHGAIHMAMGSNIHDKPCQLKLNDMNCHVYCHIEFGVSFGTQVGIPNIF